MNIMRKGLIVVTGLVVLACVIIGISGCQFGQSGPIMAQARSPIPDVPLPSGFKMKERYSRNMTSGPSRFVDHLYYGKADRVTVVDFFEKQMPVNGWAALSNNFTQGRSSLDFAKGSENCSISVYKNSRFGSTYVEILIAPTLKKMRR